MNEETVLIKDKFGPFLLGRFARNSNSSGEKLRSEIIIPALIKLAEGDYSRVTFDFSDVDTHPSAMEEVFGGSVRQLFRDGLSLDTINEIFRSCALYGLCYHTEKGVWSYIGHSIASLREEELFSLTDIKDGYVAV